MACLTNESLAATVFAPQSMALQASHGFDFPVAVQIYMTGHGGDEFLKFQDVAELLAQDLADALDQMAEKGRSVLPWNSVPCCDQCVHSLCPFCECLAVCESASTPAHANTFATPFCSLKSRYNEVLLMIETCEANTLTNRITAPRVITLASSLKGKYRHQGSFVTGTFSQ